MRLSHTLLLTVLTSSLLSAADWPQFRGPDGQGHAGSARLAIKWSESENVSWKTPIPGEGHSSPVVADDQIWITTAIPEGVKVGKQRALVADRLTLKAIMVSAATGKIEQEIKLFEVEKPEPKHALNSYASPTAVIVDNFVYCHFGTYGTACVDRETGKVVWTETTLHCDHQNGPGSSPVLFGDLLVIHFDGRDKQYLAAIDRHTGRVAWKTDRSGRMHDNNDFKKAYGTPLIVESNGVPLVVSPAADWVYGYDARNGSEVWKAHYGQLGFSTVPCPVEWKGKVYISTSYMKPRLLAVDYSGRGDVTESHVKWVSDKQAPSKPSMLVVKGRLYIVNDKGIASCLDAESGEELWKARLSGEYSASPLHANGFVYFFGQNGTATVFKDGPTAVEVARNQLDEGFMASPAVSGNTMFLRTEAALYRIDQK